MLAFRIRAAATMETLLVLDTRSLPEKMIWDPPLSDEAFEALAQANEELQLECTKGGEVVMTPFTGDDTGRANSEINRQLGNWWHTHKRGAVYDSSTGFHLPDGSRMSPDASYVLPETLGPRSGRGARPARRCPDFVIELMSGSDRKRRSQLKKKMESWIGNGAKLAWLIDPYGKQVLAHAPGQEVKVVAGDSIAGSGPVEGFVLDLAEVWRCYET